MNPFWDDFFAKESN